MLKRISVILVLALLVVSVAASVALAEEPPAGRGIAGAETPDTGAPATPDGFGAVTSERASTLHDIGEHASSQDTPHLGVGNVARNDGALSTLRGGVADPGTRPGDHACLIGAIDGDPNTSCEGDPGLPNR
jgi:hypothetical protein